MKGQIIIMMAVVFTSCSYPRYTEKKIRNFPSNKTPVSINNVHIKSYHFSAGQRKGSLRRISDTLDIDNDIKGMLHKSLELQGFSQIKLVHDTSLDTLIDPKLRWRNRKLVDFLREQKFDDNTLVPIICYNVSIEPERSGGGGLEFVYKTGNDSYMIGQQLYIAYYQSGDLVYLGNISRWDEKIVPAGTPITHEFPQHVLDTLMNMALEPLLEQMEKNASKHQKP